MTTPLNVYNYIGSLKQRGRDGVINDFLSQYRYLIVALL